MKIENFVRDVRTWVEINRAALRRNAAVFRKLIRLRQGYGGHVGPRVRLMAVVKSNAYGHGLTLITKLLARLSFAKQNLGGWFGVDSIIEALRLRREGIKNSILVFGYTLPSCYTEASAKRIALTISHFEGLRALGRTKSKPAFHLKIDTGMHRQGFQEYEMPELIAVLKKIRLKPQGVYSHFAAAENRVFSQKQIAGLERCIGKLKDAGIKPRLRHMAATGGTLYYPRARYDMVRIGLGLYGYLPSRKVANRKAQIELRPVMTWKTIVGEVKRVRNGERIGYDLTEKLKRDSLVAILPIGYWHGFDRGLSSIGEVLIRGRRTKVLGRVSMDMTVVDITDIPGVRIGDEVVLIGRQGKEFIGADEMAAKIGTTAYEVLTRVNPLIKRILT